MTNLRSSVTVIGAGYVGLVTSACLAELGHTVVCVEINPLRLAMLERGEIPIYEPGLEELVRRHRTDGRLTFTDDYTVAIPAADFAFIAVNTPPAADGRADTSFVFSAADAILAHARPGLIIVTKSTVPVGTGDALAQRARAGGHASVKIVSNPEFLREGSALADFMVPDRIVVGAADPAAGRAVAGLYASLDAPVIVCDRRSSELAKYAANAFLATRISFMNEIATLCEAAAADVEAVARVMGTDRRIGPAFLRAGLGWGGSCFPKDVRALAAIAADHGHPSALLPAAVTVNAQQRGRVVAQLVAAVQGRTDATVGILGLAFKPGTDDVRESPALAVAERLHEDGIRVRAHDPVAMANAQIVLPGIEYCHDPYEVAVGCDALLLATEWPDYLVLDWHRLRERVRGTVLLDARNALDGKIASAFGFDYRSIGRPGAPHTVTHLRVAAEARVERQAIAD